MGMSADEWDSVMVWCCFGMAILLLLYACSGRVPLKGGAFGL